MDAQRDRIEAASREAGLQARLDLERGDLGHLKAQLEVAQGQLQTTSQSLSDANRSLADNKHMVEDVTGIDRQMAKQITLSTQMIQSSGEVIKSMDGVQHELRNVALVSALSRPQTNFEVEIEIRVLPRGFTDEPNPENPTDLFFQNWKKLGDQAPDAVSREPATDHLPKRTTNPALTLTLF